MEPTSTTKRLLVVEDDSYLRDLYVDILKGEGYAVDAAADGEEGYQALLKNNYSLVLLDIMLPKMDGITILEHISRETAQTPVSAVVILTNLGQDTTIAKAVSLGARGYMVKSDYTPDQVISKVKDYLGQQ